MVIWSILMGSVVQMFWKGFQYILKRNPLFYDFRTFFRGGNFSKYAKRTVFFAPSLNWISSFLNNFRTIFVCLNSNGFTKLVEANFKIL